MTAAIPVWSIYERQTGQETDKEVWKGMQHRRAVLDHQSEKLANILEEGGIVAKTGRLKMVGAVTGAVKEIVNYRSICFLPVVAKRKRGAMLRDLIYWQQNTPGATWCRYMVVTNGQLIPISELKEAIKAMNRKISKFGFLVKNEFDIDLVFRGLEFPVKPDGKVHLHANILYMPKHRLSPERWKAFLEKTHEYFGTVLKDNGRLRNPREAVKYSFKPNDLDQATPEDICELYRQTFRSRLVDALGSFKEFRAGIKNDDLRTVWDGKDITLAKRRERTRENVSLLDETEPAANSRVMSSGDRLVGILPPMPIFSQFAEPIVLIEGDAQNVFDADESLRVSCKEFAMWWEQRGAPATRFKLDNRTLTVLEKPPPECQYELFESG